MALFVSCGNNCYVSWTLRRAGFQSGSYPLDWVNSFRFDKTIEFIRSFDRNIFARMTKSPLLVDKDNQSYYLEDYQIRMPHEHETEKNISTEGIVERYVRRFARLKKDCAAADFVIFLRTVAHRCYELRSENSEIYNSENLKAAEEAFQDFCGHDRFAILILAEPPFEPKGPTDKVLFAKLELPFENGFFVLVKSKPTMNEAIEQHKSAFSRLSKATDIASLSALMANPIVPF